MMPVLTLVVLLGAMQASPPSSLTPELTGVRAQILEGRSDSALEQLARMPADAPSVRSDPGGSLYSNWSKLACRAAAGPSDWPVGIPPRPGWGVPPS